VDVISAKMISQGFEDDTLSISSQQNIIHSKAGGARVAMAREIDQIQEKRGVLAPLSKLTSAGLSTHPGFQLAGQKPP
jgi:hypothetical protein